MAHDFGIALIKKVFSLENYGLLMTIAISLGCFVICLAVSYLLALTKITKRLFVGK